MQEPPNLLQWVKYLMILSGQWNFHGKLPLVLSMVYKINMAWIYVFILVIHSTFLPTAAVRWQCKSNVIEMMIYYMRLVGCYSITMILKTAERENIIRMIRDYELEQYNKENEVVQRIYYKFATAMNVILKVSMVSGVFAVTHFYITGMKVVIKITEECPLVEGLLLQIWYPFDTKKYMWVAKIVDILITISSGVFLTYSKLLPMSLLVFGLAHIKMLQEHVRQLDPNTERFAKENGMKIEDARGFVIKDAIKKHEDVISMMEDIQSVTSVVVMIFFFGEPLALASYLVKIVLTDDPYERMNAQSPFVISIVQLYVFSRLATEIIEESRRIADIIYNETEWINYNKRDRLLLLLMMLRSQRHLSVKAAMLGDTSLETFTKIIKTCYSIQTFYATLKKDV